MEFRNRFIKLYVRQKWKSSFTFCSVDEDNISCLTILSNCSIVPLLECSNNSRISRCYRLVSLLKPDKCRHFSWGNRGLPTILRGPTCATEGLAFIGWRVCNFRPTITQNERIRGHDVAVGKFHLKSVEEFISNAEERFHGINKSKGGFKNCQWSRIPWIFHIASYKLVPNSKIPLWKVKRVIIT